MFFSTDVYVSFMIAINNINKSACQYCHCEHISMLMFASHQYSITETLY